MEDSDCVKGLPSERTNLSTGFTAFVSPVFVFEAIIHKFAQRTISLWTSGSHFKIEKWQEK